MMKHKKAATSEKQASNKGDSQIDPTAENCKAYTRVSHQAPENDWLGIVEQPTPFQAEKK
jgi:hypothetical protein